VSRQESIPDAVEGRSQELSVVWRNRGSIERGKRTLCERRGNREPGEVGSACEQASDLLAVVTDRTGSGRVRRQRSTAQRTAAAEPVSRVGR